MGKLQDIDPKRVVRIAGKIDANIVTMVERQIADIMQQNKDEYINLIISSSGGSIVASFALYDSITKVLKPKLQTIVTGAACSMAPLLFLLGENRAIGPNAYLAFHDLGLSFQAERRLSITEMQRDLNSLKKERQKYINVVVERTNNKTSAKEMLKMMKKEITIFPDKAVTLGFTHEILK